jgi:hypothetical protein
LITQTFPDFIIKCEGIYIITNNMSMRQFFYDWFTGKTI